MSPFRTRVSFSPKRSPSISALMVLLLTTTFVQAVELDEPARRDSGPVKVSALTAENARFMVSEQQFEEMFPDRIPIYSYEIFLAALDTFPSVFASGSEITRKQEAAAFFANIHHESGGLTQIQEADEAKWPTYCDPNQPCAPGQLYFGRGPIQLSWNYNYSAAGDDLGLDLLQQPDLVARNPVIGWVTALWFWTTQSAAGSLSPHQAMVHSAGFAETIRAINGVLECGKSTDEIGHEQMQHRVKLYRTFTSLIDVPTGSNIEC